MKKPLSFATLMIPLLGLAQMTFEHSYSTTYTQYETDATPIDQMVRTFFRGSEINYFTYNNLPSEIRLYDSSHAYTNTVAFDPTPYGIYLISDHLFNSDDSLEILTIDEGGIHLIAENGTVLQTIPERFFVKIFKAGENSFKMAVSHYNGVSAGGGTYQLEMDIYALPGTLSQEQFNSIDKDFVGYPNPVSSRFTVSNPESDGRSHELELFDSTGRRVLEKRFLGDGNNIEIDLSTFSSGTYIYRIGEKSFKLIKN